MGMEEELLKEHAENSEGPFDKKVAGTMAALAALLAIVSVMGHMANTEEIVNQQRASDQWSYYQAKSIRRYESEIARDMLAAAKAPKAADYEKNFERYQKDTEEIEKQAKEFEVESHLNGRKSFRFEISEVFLEVAIVLASVAILTKRPPIWMGSMAVGLAGIATALTVLGIT
jgi:Domain of unknown function (DUF4337)